jgi:hypothetical protein
MVQVKAHLSNFTIFLIVELEGFSSVVSYFELAEPIDNEVFDCRAIGQAACEKLRIFHSVSRLVVRKILERLSQSATEAIAGLGLTGAEAEVKRVELMRVMADHLCSAGIEVRLREETPKTFPHWEYTTAGNA